MVESINIYMMVSDTEGNTLFLYKENQEEEAYLLCLAFVCTLILVVYSTEVRDDNRNGQSDDKHTTK